jgi:predicted RecA/RadA family phage recombinase
MKTFVQTGDVLDLDPGATVATGTGRLFGAALFGVALVDAVSGTASAFKTEGVVTIAKTSALAISVGDRLFWDATNSVVNKTTTAQQQVGVAVEAAANPSSTVKMKIMPALPVAT